MYILSLSPVATCVTAASHRFIIIALMALLGRSSLILFVPKCVLISSFLQRPRKSSQNEVNRQVRSELVPGQDPKGQAGRRHSGRDPKDWAGRKRSGQDPKGQVIRQHSGENTKGQAGRQCSGQDPKIQVGGQHSTLVNKLVPSA